MDTTETTDPIVPDYPLPDLLIGQEAKSYLLTAGKWAKFLGILGFIATAIIALLCVFAGAVSPIMGALSSSSAINASAGALSIVPLLLIMILYFFVSYFLYQFGTNIKNGIAVNDMLFVTKAFRNLKSHFKLIGITLIIIVVIYIVAFIVGGLLVGSTFMHH